MKIEVISLDIHDMINNYKHFYVGPPRMTVTLEAIKEYIDNELPKKEYDDMIKFIYGIAIKGSDEEIENEKHDACFMLSYYTNQQVKNDYNDDPRKYNTYRTILSNTQWFDRYITGNFYTLEMINPTKRKRTTNKTEKDKEAEEVDTKKTIEDELSYSEVPMQDPCTIS